MEARIPTERTAKTKGGATEKSPQNRRMDSWRRLKHAARYFHTHRWSAGDGALGRPESRSGAELLHQAKCVPTDVGIHNLSVGDVIDGDSIHGYFFTRGRNSAELSFMSAGNSPTNSHLIVLGNQILHCETQIGEA